MDRLTRKELKKDKFAQEVGHTVEFLGEHRRQFIRYGGIALAAVVVLAGWFYYGRLQHSVRQRELYAVSQIMTAPVSVTPTPGVLSFVNEAEKNQAILKALTGLATKYPGTDEGSIAQYYLGTMAVNQGRIDDAAKFFGQAAGSSNEAYASLAKLALAEVYGMQGKTSEAEKLLRSLVAKPTVLVPREEATITLARLLASSNPAEARKLFESLKAAPSAASRAASTALDETVVKK